MKPMKTPNRIADEYTEQDLDEDCRWRRKTIFLKKTYEWSRWRPRTRPGDEDTEQHCQWIPRKRPWTKTADEDTDKIRQRRRANEADEDHARGLPMKTLNQITDEYTGQCCNEDMNEEPPMKTRNCRWNPLRPADEDEWRYATKTTHEAWWWSHWTGMQMKTHEWRIMRDAHEDYEDWGDDTRCLPNEDAERDCRDYKDSLAGGPIVRFLNDD